MTDQELCNERGETPAQRWDQDAAKRSLDELFAFASRYRDSQSYRELMDFLIRFKRYAPFNGMLVHIQKPGARYVLTASRWLEYGRRVVAEAQPLLILQPMGPVMFVFDVSDTEGEGHLPHEITNPFDVRGRDVERAFSRTVENAVRDGVRVATARYGSQQAGLLKRISPDGPSIKYREASVPLRYELVLSDSLIVQAKFATLAHELAHLYCGHLGTPDDRLWPDRRGLDHETREFEAESVAYLVCRRAGLEPRSDRYLASHLRDRREVPPISLSAVVKAAGLIEEMGERAMPPRRERRRHME